MPNFTKEQTLAIEKDGTNIIVSAGAGSGKTEVLSERVIYKLKKGIKINELLILTFSNAASAEMKDRIRKKILKNPDLSNNLDYLESAYITTFDSFTLSLVKKYHYLINVSPNLSIIDASIIDIVKKQIIDTIFDEFYAEDDELFNKLIDDLTVKNDTQIKNAILKIIGSLENISDIDNYLENYLETFLSDEKIKDYISEYLQLIFQEVEDIETNLMYLENTDYGDFYNEMVASLEPLIKAKTYEELYRTSFIKLPKRPKGTDDVKEYKDNIDAHLKNIRDYLRFDSEEEIRKTFKITEDYIKIIIKIIKRYFVKIKDYKNKEDLYEFNDIALMAINLLKEHKFIRDELKDSIKEIMVDEYQDTNDIQEEFINLIENNNVYMVGDIKQSIYGFRNANPNIFRDKYDRYAKMDNGIKIDLLKNFRSRSEVLDGINEIFSLIMDQKIGSADYKVDHQMNFGNTMYLNKNANQNYNLEILNYDSEGEVLEKSEIEAFIIGYDILNKINNNYEIIDKSSKELRNATYKDFCIIMDRGTNFPVYKKIFEYLGIPLTIYEDKKLTNEIDIILLKNIIGFILKIKDKVIDQEFKYYFMSIARSFLFEYSDNTIFEIIKNNTYKETDIYKLSLDIVDKIDTLDNYELLELILDKFNFYGNIIKIGNVEEVMIRIDNILSISKNLSKMGYTLSMFKDYLSEMIESRNEIKYSANDTSSDSVKIMNIHKSKGLEFPVCYFSGYYKKFNTSDIKDRFIYDNEYGIITPYFEEGIGTTILKDLYKEKYILNDISEQIRLFYVALTRAKEKIIIVAPLDDNKTKVKNIVDNSIRKNYTSFLSILNSISGNIEKYITNIDLGNINLTKDYLNGSKKGESENLKNEVINYEVIDIPNNLINKKSASKNINEFINEEKSETLKIGTSVHKVFEQTDFMHIKDDNKYKKQIVNFVKKLNITENTEVYKEYEFIHYVNNTKYQGIIDLILVDKDIVKIVDYKLKNIDDEKYNEQLNIYYRYLKTIFDKEIKMYLYSIMNDELKEIKVNQ